MNEHLLGPDEVAETSAPTLSPSGEAHLPFLMDERSPRRFRQVFGEILARSRTLETAILRIRLGAVDLTEAELAGVDRLRILAADVNARTVEEEAYGLRMDEEKRDSLTRILKLLREGRMEIRSAPLGGWSPDFSVFSGPDGPEAVIVGLHWFRRPFPHRGPAWAACFGPGEARAAQRRFGEIWREAHDIAPAILRLLER